MKIKGFTQTKEGRVLCEKAGLELIEVPAGKFVIGCTVREEPNAPVVKGVYLDSYLIGRFPVTNGEFGRFVEDRGYEREELWSPEGWSMIQEKGWTEPTWWNEKPWNEPRHPVVGVSWYEAEAFCNWASLSLPTEAQWVKAARGDTCCKYPWGDEDVNVGGVWQANCHEEPTYGSKSTSPVGSFPAGASPCGCEDMAGNVWEWCLDWYDKDFYRRMPKKNPANLEASECRVLLGGSFWFYQLGWSTLAVGNRRGTLPFDRNRFAGFRAAGNRLTFRFRS